ncbi:MAG: TonB-dependent receptor [Gracilimonas sp.]|uniref:TonB-dependent receptor domain-containing protein n=1 Tax=Gracilimonas sp. TaxID=1974203 RepID=UPI0037503453|nr:TonB-dependent receptor [Gracilimonas sp.]
MKNQIQFFLLVVISFCFTGVIWAQTGTIEGKVTDSQGEVLPGVNVVIDFGEEVLGASTDVEGNYRITSVPVGRVEVTARFLGFGSQTREVEVEAGEVATVNFSLTSSTIRMDELVVTGTGGEVSREKIGTSITSINTNDLLENASINSFDEILEGRAAGLRSVQTSGTVGGGNDLRVRGTSSFTLGQRPAVYIDGVRVDTRATEWAGGGSRFSQEFSGGQGTDRLSDLSPNEIQTVEIVKGAAAATLYGSDASNGVIQIITNKGKFNSKPQWSLRTSVGFNRHRANFPTKLFPNFEGPGGFQAKDANETLIENGIKTTNSLSVEGGGSDFSYFISGSYSSEEGSIQPNWMRRGNLRANLRWRVDNKWNISLTTGYSRNKVQEQQAGNNWNALLGNAILGNPRVATEDRPFGEPWTPVEVIRKIEAFTDANRFTTGLNIRYNPRENFSQRLVLGLDAVGEQRERFLPYGEPYTYVPAGERNLFHRSFESWTFDYLGNYRFSITENIENELSWGGQGFWEFDQMVFATGREFAGPGVTTVGGGAQTLGNEQFTEVVTLGVYTQTRLSFYDKLHLALGFRLDGNSAFGANYGLQEYPKAEVSYMISEEDFFPDLFSSFKVRAALGMAGQSPGAFDQFRTFSPQSVLGEEAGVIPSTPGNPDLEPEKSTEFETGIEGGIWEDRVYFDFTYFRQRTTDALVPIALPPSEGFAQAQLRNIGEIENIGWELALDLIPIQSSNFTWDTNLKLSGVKNEVLDIGGVERFPAGSAGTGGGTGWVVEGYPVAGVWEYEPVSYDSQSETWQRTNELVYQGPTFPTFTGSIENVFNYKQFRLGIKVSSELGAVFTNGSRQYQNNFQTGDEYLSTLDENQQPTAESTKLYEYYRTFPAIDSRDHIKIQQISLSYNLPEKTVERLGLGRTTINLTGNELHWWDNSNATHPQINYLGGASFAQGSGFLAVPPPRSVMLSISTRF